MVDKIKNKSRHSVEDSGSQVLKNRDQRKARSERSKKAITQAMLDLVIEGNLLPTAKKIAEYAGVSVRLVFHHFPDLEAIRIELINEQFQNIQERISFDVSTDMPLGERIDLFVSQRTELLEFISPLRKVAVSIEPHSKSVSQGLKWLREFKRQQVEKIFFHELAIYSEDEASKRLSALQAALAWPTWNSLRLHQELCIEDAESVIKKMVLCIIGSVL